MNYTMDDAADVKPAEPVVSYLGPLTSLSKDLIDRHGLPLAAVR